MSDPRDIRQAEINALLPVGFAWPSDDTPACCALTYRKVCGVLQTGIGDRFCDAFLLHSIGDSDFHTNLRRCNDHWQRLRQKLDLPTMRQQALREINSSVDAHR